MRLFDKLLKRNQEQEVERVQELKNIEVKRKPTFKEKYPYGLPLEVLQSIDYSKFGAILKQQQLLPPSYDRKPIGVEIIASEDGNHKVKLIFKSKTSNSYRTIGIEGYYIRMGINMDMVWYLMPDMAIEWERFCAKIMWLIEHKYNIRHVNDIKFEDEELGL